MNSQTGHFVKEDRAEQWMQRVEIGEVVKIKGEELEIVEIEGRHIKLKLLSAEDRIDTTIEEHFKCLDIQERQFRNGANLFLQTPHRKRETLNSGR